MRHAVLILGIARSGTSAVAGTLAAAGLPFGDGLKPPDWQNPRGNHEDFALSRLNQALLAHFGATWSTSRPLPPGWERQPGIAPFAAHIGAEIEARFGRRAIFGLKDPRLVPLYPLYSDILRKARWQPHLVTVERDRREVLTSIRRSGYFHGLYLPWRGRRLYRHYMDQIAALRADPGSNHVHYAELVADPEGSVARLVAALPFDAAGVAPDVARGAGFIDAALWRNRAPGGPGRPGRPADAPMPGA